MKLNIDFMYHLWELPPNDCYIAQKVHIHYRNKKRM